MKHEKLTIVAYQYEDGVYRLVLNSEEQYTCVSVENLRDLGINLQYVKRITVDAYAYAKRLHTMSLNKWAKDIQERPDSIIPDEAEYSHMDDEQLFSWGQDPEAHDYHDNIGDR